MSTVTRRPKADRVVIRNVSWETYEHLLKDLENQSLPRLTYDRGVLEMMSPYWEHARGEDILSEIAKIALEETDTDFEGGGPVTFKREDLKRGFEPDRCFYIRNAEHVRGKKRLDLSVDPPPDLLIEMDVATDSMDKFPLFAAMGMPEVWRCEDAPEIWVLRRARYLRRKNSLAIPILSEKLITELMHASLRMKRPAWLRRARRRMSELLKSHQA
jgi:Uma2 family endonuclease